MRAGRGGLIVGGVVSSTGGGRVVGGRGPALGLGGLGLEGVEGEEGGVGKSYYIARPGGFQCSRIKVMRGGECECECEGEWRVVSGGDGVRTYLRPGCPCPAW